MSKTRRGRYIYVNKRAVARHTDPSTSWAAARSVKGITELQHLIWALLIEYGPMADHEILPLADRRSREIYGKPVSPSSARTRRAEMVDMGYIRDSHERKLTAGKRKAVVWKAITMREMAEEERERRLGPDGQFQMWDGEGDEGDGNMD